MRPIRGYGAADLLLAETDAHVKRADMSGPALKFRVVEVGVLAPRTRLKLKQEIFAVTSRTRFTRSRVTHLAPLSSLLSVLRPSQSESRCDGQADKRKRAGTRERVPRQSRAHHKRSCRKAKRHKGTVGHRDRLQAPRGGPRPKRPTATEYCVT